jgi:addiction module HigA family antidote
MINGESVFGGAEATHTKLRSPITTEGSKMARKAHEPIHPGEILLEEFLQPMELSQYRLAKDISVPARRINEIVHGKRSITADTALRLARYLGTSERFWMNLQTRYDLEVVKGRLKGRLAKEVAVLRRAS